MQAAFLFQRNSPAACFKSYRGRKNMKLSHLQNESIIPNEKGILSRNGRGFYFSSAFARENLYHLIWSDDYICDASYDLEREKLNCYMLMNMMAGRLSVRAEGRRYTAREGSIIFLDLRKPHAYKAETTVHMQQFMMNGGALAAYHDLLTKENGPIFHKDSRLQYLMNALKKETMVPVPNDHTISMLINSVLCSLTSTLNQKQHIDPVRQAQYFINDHYREDITLDDIAGSVSLSKYYFSRMFEKETGSSPWKYLIETRLRNAMQLLTHSSISVEEISFSCGFSSAAHFIRLFKEYTGFTPGAFRHHCTDVPMGFMFIK